MANPLLNAKVKRTGKQVEVYAHHLGGYVDYSDCGTLYKANEIELIKDKNGECNCLNGCSSSGCDKR